MLSHPSKKTTTGTTRGVVLFALLLSLFAFSGLESEGSTRESQSTKTEVVVAANRRVSPVVFYGVAGQKSIFNFYPFRKNDFLRFQNYVNDIKLTVMTHQQRRIPKIFNRYRQVYSSRFLDEHITNSLQG